MQGVAGETLPGRAAMNAIMDNILTRRSVRSFVSDKKKKLKKTLGGKEE